MPLQDKAYLTRVEVMFAKMVAEPQLRPLVAELEVLGPLAWLKYWKCPDILSKFGDVRGPNTGRMPAASKHVLPLLQLGPSAYTHTRNTCISLMDNRLLGVCHPCLPCSKSIVFLAQQRFRALPPYLLVCDPIVQNVQYHSKACGPATAGVHTWAVWRRPRPRSSNTHF